MSGRRIIEAMKQAVSHAKYFYGDMAYGEDILGMTCCTNGRIGDRHRGCYQETLFQQKRNQTSGDESK